VSSRSVCGRHWCTRLRPLPGVEAVCGAGVSPVSERRHWCTRLRPSGVVASCGASVVVTGARVCVRLVSKPCAGRACVPCSSVVTGARVCVRLVSKPCAVRACVPCPSVVTGPCVCVRLVSCRGMERLWWSLVHTTASASGRRRRVDMVGASCCHRCGSGVCWRNGEEG
jgi:hypothetical protein